jgi:hypothetical protein
MGDPAKKLIEPGRPGFIDAVGHRGYLGRHDPRWACNTVVELVSVAGDVDLLGLGSSPYTGDTAYTGIRIPSAPTTNQLGRYFFRLCGIEIPSGKAIVVRGIRQYLEIGAYWSAPPLPSVPQDSPPNYPLMLEVVSPFWHFSDGNVSWHLRHHDNIFAFFNDANQLPNTSPTLRGLDTAMLYNRLAPYAPAAGGVPPPKPVDTLGTLHEIRYPWDNTDWSLATVVSGPGLVVLYASVKQTDPIARPQVPLIVDTGALRPEDRFLIATRDPRFPLSEPGETAIYQRIAGAVTVELNPMLKGLHEW